MILWSDSDCFTVRLQILYPDGQSHVIHPKPGDFRKPGPERHRLISQVYLSHTAWTGQSDQHHVGLQPGSLEFLTPNLFVPQSPRRWRCASCWPTPPLLLPPAGWGGATAPTASRQQSPPSRERSRSANPLKSSSCPNPPVNGTSTPETTLKTSSDKTIYAFICKLQKTCFFCTSQFNTNSLDGETSSSKMVTLMQRSV